MSKFQFPINEVKRAAATIMLSVGVAAAYIAVMAGDEFDPKARASATIEAAAQDLPERPAGNRRWRSSNAEQSLPTLTYFGEPDAWGRNRAELEGAMTLFQMGNTLSSMEFAGGTVSVTVSNDYLSAYLAMPFLGGDTSIAFTLDNGVGNPFVVAQVLTRAFAAEQLAQK
jgi:hypothetical protein